MGSEPLATIYNWALATETCEKRRVSTPSTWRAPDYIIHFKKRNNQRVEGQSNTTDLAKL